MRVLLGESPGVTLMISGSFLNSLKKSTMHKVAVCRRETAFQGGYRTYESKKEKKREFPIGPEP
jgi:hypothetical protein